MAHEICHYAMQLLYKNDCKPYYATDANAEEEFQVAFEFG